MRICDLQSSTGRLRRSVKSLKDKWDSTREHWNDKTSREFEENFLRPLLPEITMAISSVYKLNEMLERAEKECEDREPQ